MKLYTTTATFLLFSLHYHHRHISIVFPSPPPPFLQLPSIKYFSSRGGWPWANDVSVPRKGHPRTPGMEFFCTVPRLHFLGRALIWPGCFGERILDVFGLYSSSLSKSVGFVSLSGKALLVSISAAILFLRSWHVYFPLEFGFRGKSCVE